VIQRFGSGANLDVHFHALVLDGVFAEVAPDRLRFHATPRTFVPPMTFRPRPSPQAPRVPKEHW
jgi:hypothetical protein